MRPLNHPNALVGGTAGVGGGELVVQILDQVGVHVAAGGGVAIAGGLTALALFVGRNGLRGLVRLILNGTGAGKPPAA